MTADKIFSGERSVNEIDDRWFVGHPFIKGKLKSALEDFEGAERNLSGYFRKYPGRFSDTPLSKKKEVGDIYEDDSLYHEKAEVLDKVSKSGGGLTEVLTSIATIRPRLVGRATLNQYNQISNSIKTFKIIYMRHFI